MSQYASFAVDGRMDTLSCTTKVYRPWLSVDLRAAYDVGRVTVTNEMSPTYGDYLVVY